MAFFDQLKLTWPFDKYFMSKFCKKKKSGKFLPRLYSLQQQSPTSCIKLHHKNIHSSLLLNSP